MTIFHLITPHILFDLNLDETFKNFIGNFTVAKNVYTQVAYSISWSTQVAWRGQKIDNSYQ